MDSITVSENNHLITFTYAEILAYHGGGFPGGVVHGLKAMQAGFALLDSGPLQRREIRIETAFTGPGGRDALEMVTRALTDGRLHVDRSLGGLDVITDLPGPYFWRFLYRDRMVEARIKPGHVRKEFVDLGAKQNKTREEIQRHEALKQEMADRLLPCPAHEIYSVTLTS